MKRTILGMMILAVTFVAGCDDDNDHIISNVDHVAPPVPQGVYSITGDQEVLLYWLPVDDVDGDFDSYVVYRSDYDSDTGYLEIGQTMQEYFIDDEVINGYTYYYAVSSLDKDGNLSDLSYESVFDTPRPQGANAILFDFNTLPSYAGWDFSSRQTISYASSACDIYLEYVSVDGVFYFDVAAADIDIQDMGYTGSLDDVGYAPDAGWSLNGWCEVILGHTYVIWTADNHYAKVRVTAIEADHIVFDWAYQVDPGNPELKPMLKRIPGYLRHLERTS